MHFRYPRHRGRRHRTRRHRNARPWAWVALAAIAGVGASVGGFHWISSASEGSAGERIIEIVRGGDSPKNEGDDDAPGGITMLRHDQPLSIQEIFEQNAAGIVRVEAPRGDMVSVGTGFVISEKGLMITNWHVVRGNGKIRIAISDSEKRRAVLVRSDPTADLALLRVQGKLNKLGVVRLGDSDDVRVGDEVVAIGNPLGLERTVTSGIISALNRTITAPVGNGTIAGVIQTDATLNHGSSGGPLFNAYGEVIGITSAIAQEDAGIGYAIPINEAKARLGVSGADAPGSIHLLGIEVVNLTSETAELLGLGKDSGVLVTRVEPGSSAEKAGLRGSITTSVSSDSGLMSGGDVITAIDGQVVKTARDVERILEPRRAGERIRVTFVRNGRKDTLTVKLAEAAA